MSTVMEEKTDHMTPYRALWKKWHEVGIIEASERAHERQMAVEEACRRTVGTISSFEETQGYGRLLSVTHRFDVKKIRAEFRKIMAGEDYSWAKADIIEGVKCTA